MMKKICPILLILPLCATISTAGDKEAEPVYKLPVLTDNLEERVAAIRTVAYTGPERNDNRCGAGYTGPELFELHRELRLLVHANLHRAPSEREFDLLRRIMYGKPDRKKDLIDVWDENQQAYISEYGPFVVWAYKPGRQSTEDYIHLHMDMEAFDDIQRETAVHAFGDRLACICVDVRCIDSARDCRCRHIGGCVQSMHRRGL